MRQKDYLYKIHTTHLQQGKVEERSNQREAVQRGEPGTRDHEKALTSFSCFDPDEKLRLVACKISRIKEGMNIRRWHVPVTMEDTSSYGTGGAGETIAQGLESSRPCGSAKMLST